MREIAREMKMAPSALYRYFENRDALLTTLINDAYNDLGAAVEGAIAGHPDDDPHARWEAAAHATRDWARSNPSTWGLIYGTPIPGYAPVGDITKAPAMRITAALTTILTGALAHRRVDQAKLRAVTRQYAPVLLDEIEQVAARLDTPLPAPLLAAGISAWTQLIGVVTFEVFHHLDPLFADPRPMFEHHVRRIDDELPLKDRR